MVALGMRLMLRPSELVGLRRRHVRFDERGWMWVKIVKRKNDQLGQRGEDPVEPVPGSPSCVVRLMRDLLDAGVGGPDTAVFLSLTTGKSISTSVVCSTAKHMVMKAGLADVVSGHSLRIGGCCQGLAAGLSMAELRAIGGWTSQAIRHYLRSVVCAENGASSRMGFG